MKEASEWRLIGLLFECPVGEWKERIKSLADAIGDFQLRTAVEFARVEAGEGLYHSIFGPGGPAPGREISYRGWAQPGFLLSELASFYQAFSYVTETNEVADHVAVECGFIAYLRLKELYAVECSDKERAEITHQAASTFIDDHLCKYAQKLSKLLTASGIEYLHLAGAALFARVGPDKDASRQIFLPVLEEDDQSMFECGVAH